MGAGALLVVLFALPATLPAQTLSTGVLEGDIRDATSATLSDVSVVISALEGGASRSMFTAGDGAFQFALLLPGTYTVLIERLGYRPQRIEGVPVQPGEHLRLDVTLTAAPPPVDAPEVVRFEGAAGGSRAGTAQWISPLGIDEVPWERRDVGELAGLATASTSALEVEGLPSWLSALTLDGVRHVPAHHPDLAGEAAWRIALPLGGLRSADLVTADPNIEWSGFAGGALSAHTRTGTAALSGRGFGSWSGGPLRSSSHFGSVSNNSLWGGALLAGPIIQDTAHFVVGLEARRIESPLPRPWAIGDPADAAVLDAGRNAHGVGLDAYTQPYLVQSDRVSGFGRFDWQLGSESWLSLRALFGEVLQAGGDSEVARAAAPGAVAEGGDMLLSAALGARPFRDWAYEVRVGVSRSTREYAQGESGTGALPSTRVVAGGQHFGIDPRLPGSFQRTGASLAQSLGIVWSQHRLQLGIDAEAGSHDDTYAYARQGEFVFGGADEFARGEGSFVRSAASLRPAAFTVLRFGAHAQDTWNASPDLQVVAGVRYDLETLPGDEVRSNEAWLAYTGLSNADVAGEVRTVSPRFGLTWDVGGRGSWIVRATAGIYASSIPPHVLTELLTLDGSATTHRGMGQLGWPSAPGSQAAPDVGPRLTLLGPDFRGPLTRRASFGLTRQLGAAATLQLSGTYRETDFLPRRSDVNLQTEPVAFDQHGRPVYGSLVQSGQLVAAPGPNRRFADFDLVSALNADGWSRRWGVTAAVESDEEGPFGLFARYTYSRTTDNWLSGQGGGPEAQLTPFRGSGGDDWTEGVSDFDLPHQMAAGFELRPSGSLQPRLTGIYRYRSGYPFTPGFRDGVDVNADGSGRNDPAFVDPAIPGTPELVSRWSCLRGQVGGFAERNACRLPGVHSLDLRLGLTLVQSSGVAASLFVDGVNLIESALAVPDRAVYLVDAGGTLTRDSALGTVSLPLVANPNFGRPLGRFSAGRLLRVGLQVTF